MFTETSMPRAVPRYSVEPEHRAGGIDVLPRNASRARSASSRSERALLERISGTASWTGRALGRGENDQWSSGGRRGGK